MYPLDCALLARRGDFLVIETDDFLEDLFGVLAQKRRAIDVGGRVGKLDRVTDGQVLAAFRVVDFDDRPVPSSTGSDRTAHSAG